MFLEVFFQWQEEKWEKKLFKKFPNCLYFGLQCCSQNNIEGWLNISASYVVYSQIWLNLPMDDHHFFYIFLWMIATLATKNKDS
jgi:hypothetical protein